MKSEYFDPRTYAALEPIMQYANVLAIRVSLETGLRIDDVLRLRWENFTGPGKFQFVAKKTGKKGKKRISLDLYRRILAQKSDKSPWCFPGRKTGKHRTRQTVWRDIKRAAEQQGIKSGLSPHSARKTYAVGLREREGLPAVQRELQHASKETTMLYAFADVAGRNPVTAGQGELAEAVARRVVELLLPILEGQQKKDR